MNALDPYYCQLLNVGFIVLRQALDSQDNAWTTAEIEHLHNVPSLIGETNVKRHRYFWFTERQHYLDWIAESGSAEAKSRMKTFYQPIWDEMEPVMAECLDTENSYEKVKTDR